MPTIILLLAILAILATAACWLFRMELSYLRFRHAVDSAAARYGIPRLLLATLIWQESRFQPSRRGSAGEIGLAQVMPESGREWAAAEHIASFRNATLLDPHTNAMAGAWYLARALERWKHMKDPVPYALAEYNAGPSKANRWARLSDGSPESFIAAISYPTTRRYVSEVLRRYRNFGQPWRNGFDIGRPGSWPPRGASVPDCRCSAPPQERPYTQNRPR